MVYIDELIALAQRHKLGTEVVADLTALWRRNTFSQTPQEADALQTVAGDGSPLGTETRDDRVATLIEIPALHAPEPQVDAPASTPTPTPTPPPPAEPAPIPRGDEQQTAEHPTVERYEDMGPLGVGSMGEVRRVRDPVLNRSMAMKTIRAKLMSRPNSIARFTKEAQTTAQLQHPGILPVFEMGTTRDGRIYFTMQEVRGKTFSEVMAEVHRASAPGRWRESSSGWSFRRLMTAFLRACEAVAYAHSRGVVHRDLKPANIMVGEHGEVLVVDWGLAKLLEAIEVDEPVEVSAESARSTRYGTVAGTPLYMAVEQARGELDRIGPHTDVYALGAILYEILTGRPTYDGRDAATVLDQVLAAPPKPLPTAPSAADQALGHNSTSIDIDGLGPIPYELADTCNKAMARRPADRFPDAVALAAEVSAWLDGARKRDRAIEIVDAARQRAPNATALRRRAQRRRDQANEALDALPPGSGEDQKAPAWAKLDEADALELEAQQEDLEVELLLHGALTHVPDLVEAHSLLADRYRAEHAQAEAARNRAAAARAERMLRVHTAALPDGSPERDDLNEYLEGDGAVTLYTDPPGARVQLFRYEERNRRLVEVDPTDLGQTPLRRVPLARGSYLAEISADGCHTARLPLTVGRRAHVDHHPPGSTRTEPIHLARLGDIADDEAYVPAGWFASGGDPEAPNALPGADVWADGFVMKRFPVTNAAYLRFLNALVEQGRESDALRHAPRERAAGGDELGALIYGRQADGRFVLTADADGDMWNPDWPVMMVDWDGATAYARWLADHTGLPWRLPHEWEWEKASRGTDGRFHVWGDAFDPSWCQMRLSHTAGPKITGVDTFPVDASPYGVRGLGGNVSEWCANLYDGVDPAAAGFRVPVARKPVEADGFRADKGGGWFDTAEYVRAAVRRGLPRNTRRSDVGFRVVRSFPQRRLAHSASDSGERLRRR